MTEWKRLRGILAVVALLHMAGFVTGCLSTGKPLAPVDINETGWTTLNGTGVWKPEEAATEMAGEVVLATHSDGRAFVQFTKGLPILTAQRTAQSWQISIPAENKEYRGGGTPPKRLIWAHLPDIWLGAEPPKGWTVVERNGKSLDIYHQHRGERLKILFH